MRRHKNIYTSQVDFPLGGKRSNERVGEPGRERDEEACKGEDKTRKMRRKIASILCTDSWRVWNMLRRFFCMTKALAALRFILAYYVYQGLREEIRCGRGKIRIRIVLDAGS